MTPPVFLRSIYAALLDNGIPMREIDDMPFGRYMEIVSERARRRDKRGRQDNRAGKTDKNRPRTLVRGYSDDIFG